VGQSTPIKLQGFLRNCPTNSASCANWVAFKLMEQTEKTLASP
jgi:hypothetical protein